MLERTGNPMNESELLRKAGLTADWLHEFITESNKIDPQPDDGPGSDVYTRHRDSLLYAIRAGVDDRYALPREVHRLLLGKDEPYELRTQPFRIGINDVLPAGMVKKEFWKWNRRLQQAIDLLRTDDNSIPAEHKRAEIWGLHCELMNIRPFDSCNGKMGRVLMVNHALLVDLVPWVISCDHGREDYFDVIRTHPSSAWGNNPPSDDLQL
jgi:hypothetical protein